MHDVPALATVRPQDKRVQPSRAAEPVEHGDVGRHKVHLVPEIGLVEGQVVSYGVSCVSVCNSLVISQCVHM